MTFDEYMEQSRKNQERPLRDVYPFASIGEGTYGGLVIYKWDDRTLLTIGSYTSFGRDVKILLGGEHRTDWVSQFPFSTLWPEGAGIEGHPATRGAVVIGSDVWVGTEAMILSGVIIGHGCVIAAKTTVPSGTVLPPYTMFGRRGEYAPRFRDQKIVDRLLKVAWWTWPRERIAKAVPFLCSPRIEDFLSAVEGGKL